MKSKTKKSLVTVGAGAAGNVAGSLVGAKLGHGSHTAMGQGAAIGTAVGLGVGGWVTTHKQKVKPAEASSGPKRFGNRVGTKTDGRVGRGEHPYK